MVKQETLPCLARAVVLIDENYFAFHVPELKTFPETFNRRIEQEQGQHAGAGIIGQLSLDISQLSFRRFVN